MSNLDMSRLCVLTAPFLHHTLEYGLDSIAANGFSSIELWGASPHYCLDDYDSAGRAQRVREINSMLAARGLTMAVYHPEQVRQYPVNIASPSAYLREKSLDFMRRSIEDAAAFGAPVMMLAPGWVFLDHFTQADTQRAVESVLQLAEYAKPLGVRLAMEQQDATTSLLCSTLPRLVHLVKATGIEACMDIPLALEDGGTLDAYFEAFGSLAHVHLADSGYRPFGEGSLDLEGLLAGLQARGYSGKVSVSLWGAVHYPDPDTPLRACRDWLLTHGICN